MFTRAIFPHRKPVQNGNQQAYSTTSGSMSIPPGEPAR